MPTLQLEPFFGTRLVLDSRADLIHLELCIRTIVSADPFQTLPCLIMAALKREPTNRFFESEHAETKQGGWDNLETDWNLPLPRSSLWDVFRDTVVDPVRCEDSKGVEQLEK